MANVEASWCVSLIVECPGCGEVMDLTENDNVIDGTFCSALENEKDYPVESQNVATTLPAILHTED